MFSLPIWLIVLLVVLAIAGVARLIDAALCAIVDCTECDDEAEGDEY